ncbi:hypothetical protein K502DRAFT_367556 [Neoconidiobolus thromboides FSU 785]|nr:hypothetical protein K502DRAFT_367556 [Neoconidiobolus thromboides FSU 785]
MSSVSTSLTYFPDLNYLKILLLSGFAKALKKYIANTYQGVLVELGGFPHNWGEKYQYVVSNFNYFNYTVPAAILVFSYLTDKFGIKKTLPVSLYATSVLVVVLSVAPNLTSLRGTLLALGLFNGLDALAYGLVSTVYESKYQSFAYALLFFDTYFVYLISDAMTYFFEPFKNQIPNWFMPKLLFLQHPQLFSALSGAIIFGIVAYYSHSILLPSDEKLDDTSLPTESDETQTLINEMDNTNYDSINSSQNTLYSRYVPKLPNEQSLFLLLSFVLNQFLIKNATRSLQDWYMTDTNQGGLGLGFNNIFPTLINSLISSYYLSYLFLPTTLNRFNPSYIYNITYNIATIEFAYLILVNFLQPILPTLILNLLVGLGGVSLTVCSLYANFSIILLLSRVKDANVGTFTIFGLALGGFEILNAVQVFFRPISLFAIFSTMEISYFNILNPSLVIFTGVAFLNRYFSEAFLTISN